MMVVLGLIVHLIILFLVLVLALTIVAGSSAFVFWSTLVGVPVIYFLLNVLYARYSGDNND